jgi:glycosyltransferase involved in cell wall biosynthesis
VVPGTGKYAGIERVVDEVASELARTYPERFDVDVLFLSRFENFVVGDRPYRKIQTEPRGRKELIRTVRAVVGRAPYDLVIVPQVEATVTFWLACLGQGRRFVLHLHGNPSRERSHFKAKVLFELMGRVVLPRLAGVFGTSPRQLTAFNAMFPSHVPHIWVPNPVRSFANTAAQERSSTGMVTYVSVGRFDYQKGQDLLLHAFATLHRLRASTRLRLVGFGAEEGALRKLIASLDLSDAVTIEHYPDSPEIPLSASDIFVCASRWEGWSLAICEALRFGLPVVSTDCEFGPSDILTDNRLGRLVPLPASTDSAPGLADAMLYYCDNLEAETRHAGFRRQYVARFAADQVAKVHAAAIASLCNTDQDLRVTSQEPAANILQARALPDQD